MKRILITGATGFLGGATARRLAAEGHEVIGTGRDPVVGARLEADGVRFVAATFDSREAIVGLCEGVDVVIHCGAKSAPWGREREFVTANIDGTQHVVTGCQQHAVQRLVHLSTPAIYFSGEDRRDIVEDAEQFAAPNAYVRTKRAAEVIVDRAAAGGLPVVTLRPRALFGPGDTTILPRLIRALEQRRLPIIGSGDNRVDLTYIDHAVDAVTLAAFHDGAILGRHFNISDGAPVDLWALIDQLCERLGLVKPSRRVSYSKARFAAGLLEGMHRALRLRSEPRLTRYSVALLACTTTLDITAARRELGYSPHVPLDLALENFVAWWELSRAPVG